MTAYAVDCRQVSFLFVGNGGDGMVFCDNLRCRYNQREICTNMKLTIANERCICFEHKRTQKRTRETDLNHRPVKHTKRNRILK